jgi:prepilin-type N-terminal cleavage/methylation domain-containing protein
MEGILSEREKMPAKDWMRGYSLLETVVSLAILAILLGIASTSFLQLAPKYGLQNAVWEINSGLVNARYKAIFEGTAMRVKFNPSGYAIEKYDEEREIWRRERECFLKGISIQANNTPTFYPEGSVSNIASINVFNSWGRYRITLAISGRIKIVRF